jgi:hypothetical protein
MNTHLYTSAFSISCFILSAMAGKIEQRVCIKFCVKFGRSATETLEMLCEAFGEHCKQRRVHVCLKLREKANEDKTFISRIIMGDKSWICGYNPETKQKPSQCKSPHSPRAKKLRQVRSSTKSMLIVLFFLMRRDYSS